MEFIKFLWTSQHSGPFRSGEFFGRGSTT